MNRKTQGLNDGYIGIYTPDREKTDFNAEISPKGINNMTYVMDMAYKGEYKRDQDYEFAEASGHSLSLKVRTLLYEKISKEHKVILNGTLYNILKIDYARSDRVMYLYLEEERKIVK